MSNVSYKIIINPKDLLKTLAPFAKVINNSTVLPILESICVLVEDKKATFYATDLETCIIVEYDVEQPVGQAKFSFCVEYKMLLGFLKDCELAPVVIEYTPSAKMLYIKQEDFRLRLQTEEADGFPKMPVVEKKLCMTMDTKEVMPVMNTAVMFTSNDQLRPAMTGVYLHDSAQRGLTVAATDAHRLYWKSLSPKTPDTMKGVQVIIPSRSVRAMKECMKGETMTLLVGDHNGIFESGPYKLYFRHIDARYPDYEVVMVQTEVHFYLKRKQLATFLKLALHFVNKSTNQVSFVVKNDTIATKGGDVDFDIEFSYKVPIYNSNKADMSFEFAANAKFLMQAITIVKDDYIKIQTTMTNNKAFYIDECMLVMPLLQHPVN